jgi:immune inhibitor A
VLSLVLGLPARNPARAGSDTPKPDTLRSLLQTTRPPTSDLVALTLRLKLHGVAPRRPASTTQESGQAVGHVDRFFVSNGNANGFTRRAATLAIKTPHAYFYVEQGVSADLGALVRSADTFERRTYPTDRAFFGSERVPGSRGDPRITIYNGNVPDTGAYFSSPDLFPRYVNQYSNQREITFVNVPLVRPGTTTYDLALAHELQHLIHFREHPADEAWINEGASVLAQVLNGYSATGYDVAKARAPGTPLDSFDPVNCNPYYGGGYLWLLYLYEHFGGAKVTRLELADRGLSHMAVFGDMFAKLGLGRSVDDVFADWIIANLLNDRHLNGARYAYSRPVPPVVPRTASAVPFANAGSVYQYAADYRAVGNPSRAPITLHFAGQSTVPLLATVTPPGGFWWSNRGDGVDTTLTSPPVSLKGVTHARLRYRVWYDLERDFDYGYVEISIDSGKSWFAQPTSHTTSSNPNGANLGIGYTGSSCSQTPRSTGCWLDESVDLSAYRGKRILIRFEQVTDDEYNGQGLAVSDIRVPEAGFGGDPATPGWHAAGWLYAGSNVAEKWLVQVVAYTGSGIRVSRVPIAADGQGSLHVPAGTSRAIVAVSALAPLTKVAGRYRISGA